MAWFGPGDSLAQFRDAATEAEHGLYFCIGQRTIEESDVIKPADITVAEGEVPPTGQIVCRKDPLNELRSPPSQR